MTIEEINKQLEKYYRNELSYDEQIALRDAILDNDEARQFAISGAIKTGNYTLAYGLSIWKRK